MKSKRSYLERVGEYFYGYDETSLMSEVSKLLQEKQLTIAAAESLTGGMFQKELTAIPGAGNLLKVEWSVIHLKSNKMY